MKLLPFLILGAAMLAGGCVTHPGDKVAASDDDSYTPTGTMLPRKGAKAETTTVDKDQLENQRNTTAGTLRAGRAG